MVLKNCEHSKKSLIHRTEEACFRSEIKITKLRKDILMLILDSPVPLKAYDIIDKLKLEKISTKPITVYRILDIFVENNIVHKIKSKNSFLACSHPGEKHNCYFLICSKCSQVEEGCQNNILESIYKESAHNLSLISHITLEIEGVCKECAH